MLQKTAGEATKRKASRKRTLEQAHANINEVQASTRAKIAKSSHKASKHSAGECWASAWVQCLSQAGQACCSAT